MVVEVGSAKLDVWIVAIADELRAHHLAGRVGVAQGLVEDQYIFAYFQHPLDLESPVLVHPHPHQGRVIQFSNSIPMRANACAGWAANRRQAAAIFVWPAHLSSPIVVLRSAAMTWGCFHNAPAIDPPSNVTSRTQCDLFSMLQCPRTKSSTRPGVARSGVPTCDSIDHFYAFLSCFLNDDVTPQLKNLRETGPSTVAHQRLTGGDFALLDAPMANVGRYRAVS